MIKFYYTAYQQDKSVNVDTMEEALDMYKDHFFNGKSCSQAIVDTDTEKYYVYGSIADNVNDENHRTDIEDNMGELISTYEQNIIEY